MKNAFALVALALLAADASALTPVAWDSDPLASIKEGLTSVPAPAAPAATELARPASGPFVPEIVSDPAAFALTAAEQASLKAGLPAPGGALSEKVLAISRRAFVWSPDSSSAPRDAALMRVISWNTNAPGAKETDRIVRALQGDESALAKGGDRVKRELAETSAADVYMLQEIGLPAARDLARRVGLHLVWAPEYFEIGSNAEGRDPAAGEDMTGNAILSRYPLSEVRVLRFAKQSDWYGDEAKPTPLLEKGKREAGKRAFSAEVRYHETRLPAPYGGRMALVARAAVPYATERGRGDSVQFVDIHLESKAKPGLRRTQMDEVIAAVKGSASPVVFGGDLNTLGGDGRQMTFGSLLIGQVDTPGKAIDKAASVGFMFVPYAGWGKDGFEVYKFFKAKEDPTSVLNPEHRLFGDVHRELGVKPLNERDTIGYKHTWATPSPKQFAARVLDWLFLYDPSGALAVSGARTYEDLVSKSAEPKTDRLSDHFPVRADIPLTAARP